MKWKRSRKAQQESKNKDNHSSNNEEKQSRNDRSSGSNNQSAAYKNGSSEKVASNTTTNNFHFPKNIDPNNHLPPHPVVLHQRHLNSLPGSSKEMMVNNTDENYSSNIINRQQQNVYNEPDLQEIWRVV